TGQEGLPARLTRAIVATPVALPAGVELTLATDRHSQGDVVVDELARSMPQLHPVAVVLWSTQTVQEVDTGTAATGGSLDLDLDLLAHRRRTDPAVLHVVLVRGPGAARAQHATGIGRCLRSNDGRHAERSSNGHQHCCEALAHNHGAHFKVHEKSLKDE